MKKLTLNVEALEVETFEPEASVNEQSGSVAAHLASALDHDCYTYNRQDLRCVASSMVDRPGIVCTPVCEESYRCLLTENVEDCG